MSPSGTSSQLRFVRNAWYVAAWSSEIDRSLHSRRVLGDPIVLFRREDETVGALHDICPHRHLPLSMGQLKGDDVECGYHGMTFDCTGACVRIPGQPHIPETAKVRAYPVAERMGMVWVWMGDPALADEADIYDLPQYHQPGWAACQGDALEIACHYQLVCDNLTDPAHVSFVHLSTLGGANHEDVPVETIVDGTTVTVSRWILDGQPIPVFARLNRFKGNVDRWHHYHLYAPSIAIIDFGSKDAGRDDGDSVQIFSCHFMTPVDDNSMIDYWLHVRDFAADNPAVGEQISREFRVAFQEDKDILEAVQNIEENEQLGRPIRLAIDKGPLRARQIVDRLIDAESNNQKAAE